MIHWLKITDGYPLNIRATHNSRRKVFPGKIEFKPGMNILFGPNGFTTVNKIFHKFYQKLSKFTSTLI